MKKETDFLQRLPLELQAEILGFLDVGDWRKLRLVSRQWYCLCQRRIWAKIAIATSRQMSDLSDELSGYSNPAEVADYSYGYQLLTHQELKKLSSDLLLDYSNPAEVADYSCGYQLVTPQQLKKLRSNQHFRKTVVENTVELAVYYEKPRSEAPYYLRSASKRDNKHTYAAISELCKHVRKVRVWYEPSSRDDRFLAFQNMLDGLKPTAEFSLAIEIYDFKGQAFLDIDGMKIKDLYIKNECYCAKPELMLWKSKDKTPVKWRDLAPLCNDLVTLIVFTTNDIFRYHWIPDTIKYLELVNAAGEDYSSGSLIVPPGVEYLRITDGIEYNGSQLDTTASILFCVDLSKVNMLKKIDYYGEDAANQLIHTILGVKDILELLSIGCAKVSRFSTYEFRELASAGLGIKRLELSFRSFGKELFDYQNFLANFPELVSLEIGVYDCDNYRLVVQYRADFKFLKGVIASFLSGSPKLSQIQLHSKWELNWIVSSIPWITRIDYKYERVLYDVDVCKARLTSLK
ncbi:hypothetical protein TRVA0_015S01090 [Trichomonascus vanleenenianus]|uniref:F-box protein n=1 Tax=Trichomonascus vanleenenianus TaxID=2268995 RepID=UPI003EC9FA7B